MHYPHLDTKAFQNTTPHTPGVDACGVVALSNNGNFKPGDEVLVTGYGPRDEYLWWISRIHSRAR